MAWRAPGVLASLLLLATPAWAQTPKPAVPAAAPVAQQPSATPAETPVAAAMSTLLADGYEIRAVTILSDEVRQEVYKDPKVAPQVMVTLQKGASVAVCVAAVVNWMNQADATRNNAALCHRD